MSEPIEPICSFRLDTRIHISVVSVAREGCWSHCLWEKKLRNPNLGKVLRTRPTGIYLSCFHSARLPAPLSTSTWPLRVQNVEFLSMLIINTDYSNRKIKYRYHRHRTIVVNCLKLNLDTINIWKRNGQFVFRITCARKVGLCPAGLVYNIVLKK